MRFKIDEITSMPQEPDRSLDTSSADLRRSHSAGGRDGICSTTA